MTTLAAITAWEKTLLLTRFALELAPYLELMDEVGLTVSNLAPR